MKKERRQPDEVGIASAEEVRGLLKMLRERITETDSKASIADYIRMLQLYRELEGEQPREIRVRWVDDSTSTA